MLFLQLSDRCEQGVNKDHDLDEEGLPEEVVLELQMQQRIPCQVLRVLPKDLRVILVYVKKWLRLKSD